MAKKAWRVHRTFPGPEVIAHIVLFEPKSDCSLEVRASLVEALSQACAEIPGISKAIVGRRISLGVGYETKIGVSTYSYAAVLEFEDRQKLTAYLAHPIHTRLGQLFWDVCESTLITDVEMHDARAKDLITLIQE
jgi:hypothetical protein